MVTHPGSNHAEFNMSCLCDREMRAITKYSNMKGLEAEKSLRTRVCVFMKRKDSKNINAIVIETQAS